MSSPYTNNTDRFIILSGLEVPGLPKTLDTGGNSFIRKDEFHITLMAVGSIAERIDPEHAEALRPQLMDDFYQFVGSQPLTRYELKDDVRLVDVDGNRTIIVMAAMQGIDNLFEVLSAKHGVEIPVQPTHITLYTLPTDTFGIPINSYEQLDKVSQPLEVAAISQALKG